MSPTFSTRQRKRASLPPSQALPLAEARYKQYTARRRIASFGSQYDFGDNELRPAAPLPDFLKPLRVKLSRWLSIPAEAFSDTLVAEYRPGTPLGWHRDVPEFAVIAGVSLGASCRMRFRPYPPGVSRARNAFELCLEPRSAYVMRDEARWRDHENPIRRAAACREMSVAHANGRELAIRNVVVRVTARLEARPCRFESLGGRRAVRATKMGQQCIPGDRNRIVEGEVQQHVVIGTAALQE